MAIPDYQTVMRPVLALHSDHAEHRRRDLVAAISKEFRLTGAEESEVLPSGQNTVRSRVEWAVTYLAKAGLLDRTGRGSTQITERGLTVLSDHPSRVDNNVLRAFPQFQEFLGRKRETVPVPAAVEDIPPREAIPPLVDNWHRAVAADLLDRLRAAPPQFLERAVLKLLIAMGYGGPVGSVVHLGGSNDGGIDGLIRKDPLGLEVVYVQAKRYREDVTVQRPAVQEFVGALHGKQTDRGIFVTTSRFSPGAIEYAASVQSRIILIDGQELGRLMVEYGCGVQTGDTILLKEVDEDFFED
ncbi:restriction system protein [Acrocarpospora corrugata]|uniref:Restriction system protein n=1 Tax=Acrocarpospora corrugata TaxID=35763 RepID=A0A5M3W157_9ACTN|nr:restriction endonuclease [Acrocarpospora corrugata]GES02029.1 restriction system protein [Acrocarpospora corrugata]